MWLFKVIYNVIWKWKKILGMGLEWFIILSGNGYNRFKIFRF